MKRSIFLIFLTLGILIFSQLYLFKTYLPEGTILLDTKSRGRTGNQLFQYSAAYSLAKQTNSKLYILVDHKEKPANYKMPTDGEFALDGFNIPNKNIIYKNKLNTLYFKILKNKKSKVLRFIKRRLKIKNPEYVFENNFFIKAKETNNKTLIMTDWFESPIFFQDYKKDLLEQFSFTKIDKNKLQKFKNKVSIKNSVCIHIRRGDMKPGITHRYTSIDFQKQAINLAGKLIKEPTFYIFSDEINAVKEELGEIDNINFIEGNSAEEDLYLMSNCANNIITRSTFSWWAAYLNKNNGLVIAPFIPYNNPTYFTELQDLEAQYQRKALSHRTYPKNWVLLNENYQNLSVIAEEYIKDQKLVNQILKNYKPREFDIYTGNNIQLEICKDGDFKQNLCFLNSSLKSSKPTVVSAYYNIKSKFKHENYKEWANNFLKIPFNLVIFTDKTNSGWIKELRGDLPIVIIEKKIEEFEAYKLKDKYENFSQRDTEINLSTGQKHHTAELYMIWAEKIKFTNDMIKLNPYNSDFFVWCDIGVFRDQKYINNNYTSNESMLQDKMSIVMIQEPKDTEIKNGYVESISVGAQGGIAVGDKRSWQIYDYLYDTTRKDLMDKDLLSGKDQTVITTAILRYPELFNLIYQDPRDFGNRWWYGLIHYSGRIITDPNN